LSSRDIINLLQQDNIDNEAWVKSLQTGLYALNPEKYTANHEYCRLNGLGKADGDKGPNTRNDLLHFFDGHPTALLEIGNDLTQYLYDHDRGGELEYIVDNNVELQDQLRGEIDCILDGRHIDELTDPEEIKAVQKNWKMLGLYEGRIDGIVGKLSRTAFKNHTPAGCQPKPSIAENTPSPTPLPPAPREIKQEYNTHACRTGKNGDFGIPLHHIKAAQDAAMNGKVYKDFTPPPGKKVVVIDLGHNSKYYNKKHKCMMTDKGAHSKYTDQSETDFADPVAINLAEKYHQQGYVVAFTRNPYETIDMHYETSLNYRARVAAGLGADVFISVHANGVDDNTASYGAVYCYDGRATANDKNFANRVAQNMDIHNKGTPATVVERNFGVLRKFRELGKSDACCLLIEPGFLTNKKDAEALKRISENPDRFNDGIVNATNDYVASLELEQKSLLAYNTNHSTNNM
jgi:N-acetylmuramoyl-L-alanine amidase